MKQIKKKLHQAIHNNKLLQELFLSTYIFEDLTNTTILQFRLCTISTIINLCTQLCTLQLEILRT